MSARLGQLAAWCVLLACLTSATNAVLRYAFSLGSNAWLEAQWYLFAASVMLGAPLLLKLNEHVRVDVLYGLLSPRRKAWVDVFGLLLFLLPVCWVFAAVSLPFAWEAWNSGERSSNAGGLLRWPVKALLPLGFGLLIMQGVAELLRRVQFLQGNAALDSHYERPLQ